MIQDIMPLHLDNTYYDRKPKADDYLICLRDGSILIGGDRSGIAFPRYQSVDVSERKETTFTYLFAIGEERFFLCRNLKLPGFHYEKMTYLRKAAPQHLAYAGLVGMQIGRWYENRRFCGRCGTVMEHDSVERMMHCPKCGLMEYPKICPCVIVGVIHDGKILVSFYRNGFRDHYALIAGFAEVGETIEETVHREVMEETNLKVKNLHYYKCQPWPFSESLLFGFFCELDGSDEITIDENELAMAKWVTPQEILEKEENFALTNEMLCYFRDTYGTENWPYPF